MYKNLLDEIKNYEAVRARQNDEMLRLQDRLNGLIHTREETFKSVETDNSNDEARMRLDLTDKEIMGLKLEIITLSRRITADIHSMRTRVLEAQETSLRELDAQQRDRHAQESEIKNTLLPEAEKRVGELKEQLVGNQDECARIQKEIDEIHRLNLDLLFRDSESS